MSNMDLSMYSIDTPVFHTELRILYYVQIRADQNKARQKTATLSQSSQGYESRDRGSAGY